MQPIAYSPDLRQQEDDRQSWGEGDDEESMQQSPPRRTETKSSMPLLPPKLPLLYFEHDNVDQIDFAYHHSRSSSKSQSTSVNGTRREDSGQEANGQVENRPSPKPTPSPINTKVSQEQSSRRNDPAKLSEQNEENEDEDEEGTGARGGSFYWHSPHSTESDEESEPPFDKEDDNEESSKNEDKKEKEGKKGADRVREPLVIKPIISTVPENGLTSANALGLGGPSDWMHFNDYDATEEVDDLALYTSNKPKTAELPAGAVPKEEEANKLEASLSPRRLMAGDREILPTIQERSSENLEEAAKGSDSEQRPQSETSSAKDSESMTEHPSLSSREDIVAPMDGAVSQESLRQPPASSNEQEEKKDDEPSGNVIAQQEDASSPQTEKPPNPTPQARDRIPQQEVTQQRKSEPNSTRSRVMSNQSSQLNSPIDDDDGKEQIIISLQVPDTPAPDKAEQSKPMEDLPRERRISVLSNVEPKSLESPELLKSGRKSVFPQYTEMEDPYAGLEPWAKASLNRYVKMLKEEAAAETEEDKFTIFINFTHKETRNRTVLYNMEDESDMSEHPNKVDAIQDKDGNLRPRTSIRSKGLHSMSPQAVPVPPLPSPSSQPPTETPVAVQSSKQTEKTQARQTPSGPSHPVRAETMPIQRVPVPKDSAKGQGEGDKNETAQRGADRVTQQPPATAPPQKTTFVPHGASDDSFVMVDSPAAADEKPRTQGKQKSSKEKLTGQLREKGSGQLKEKASKDTKEKSGGKSGASLSSLKKALNLVAKSEPKDKPAQPSNLQTLLSKVSEDVRKPASPTVTGPITPPEKEKEKEKESSPAADTPDKQTEKQNDKQKRGSEGEGRAYEGDKAANRQTIYRPFSGLLRQSSIQQGSVDGGSKRSSVFDRKSLGAESASGKSPNALDKAFEEVPPMPRPVNYRFTILEPLLLVVPQEGVLHQTPQKLIRLKEGIEAHPDNFGFIHQTVLAWDSEAKKSRERYERERHGRQTENEARIDALFNENEIGYSDISQLEAEFKQREAAKKAEEDREEVGTFVASVFDVVWARINYEMDQLTPLYEECTNLVSNASAGREMFEDTEERVPIAPVMEALLILYQKLMIRHQKAFEAVLERDRRLKKTEIAPWYSMGSMEKVKRIERRFEDAEKKAILEFCRQRDERANLLMDVLDQNTLRGVGANQDYMESIMQAVRKIAHDIMSGHGGPIIGAGGKIADSMNGGRGIGDNDVVSIDEVLKAKTITAALALSSEQIVQTFHVADMLLNAADYEVSVANAKLSNADAAAFRRLREAKAKEDNKLTMDLEHRMSLIRGDTARTQEEIGKLLALLGKRESVGDAVALVGGAGPGLEDERRDSGSSSLNAQGTGQQTPQSAGIERDQKDRGLQRAAVEEGKRGRGRTRV